ncbi:unannotated protein [freshwater metagenome]|uniref:Unannotated protein n=1 Tax=freshwater metagenome TaxID=449393 RepID=A0A6J6G721_9ZZZZ
MLCALSSCFTGSRPTLEPMDTAVVVDDPAAAAVLDILAASPGSTSFTVRYEIVTNFGGLSTLAVVAVDEILGTSVEIGETRYLYTVEGTTSTCSTTTFECVTGIDETRISDRQLTSTFFKQSAIERIRQDTRVAVAPAIGREDSTVVDRASVCADFAVVDSQGAERTKTYCALTDYAVISTMETADLSVRAVSVEDSVDAARFQPPA